MKSGTRGICLQWNKRSDFLQRFPVGSNSLFSIGNRISEATIATMNQGPISCSCFETPSYQLLFPLFLYDLFCCLTVARFSKNKACEQNFTFVYAYLLIVYVTAATFPLPHRVPARKGKETKNPHRYLNAPITHPGFPRKGDHLSGESVRL